MGEANGLHPGFVEACADIYVNHREIQRLIEPEFIGQRFVWNEYDVRFLLQDKTGKTTLAIAKHGEIFVASAPLPELSGPDLLDIDAEFEYIALFSDRSTDQWQYRFNIFSELAGVA